MHTLEDINALLQDAEPSLIERVYQQVQSFLTTPKSDPDAELHALLDARVREADSPNAVWRDFDEVFDQLEAKYAH